MKEAEAEQGSRANERRGCRAKAGGKATDSKGRVDSKRAGRTSESKAVESKGDNIINEFTETEAKRKWTRFDYA